ARCVDPTGLDDVYMDAVPSPFSGKRQSQLLHARLGDVVRSAASKRNLRVQARDEHDLARSATLHHTFAYGVARVDCAVQRHTQRPVDLLERILNPWLAYRKGSIDHQAVDGTKFPF